MLNDSSDEKSIASPSTFVLVSTSEGENVIKSLRSFCARPLKRRMKYEIQIIKNVPSSAFHNWCSSCCESSMSHERRQSGLTYVRNVDRPSVLHRLGVLVEHEARCEDHEDDLVRSESVQSLIFLLGSVILLLSIKESKN